MAGLITDHIGAGDVTLAWQSEMYLSVSFHIKGACTNQRDARTLRTNELGRQRATHLWPAAWLFIQRGQ